MVYDDEILEVGAVHNRNIDADHDIHADHDVIADHDYDNDE